VLSDAADGRAASRIFGADRIKTAVAISQFQFQDPAAVEQVYLARSDVFADSVAGGVLTGGPILLVPSCDGVPSEVQDEINRLAPDTVYALGGPLAICEATLDEAAALRDEGRLSGPTRIETAIAISQHQFPRAAPTLYIARASPDEKLADSVAGGSLTGGPVLLVPECGELPVPVAGEISRVAPNEVIALGGPLAICAAMLTQAGQA
jgi:putative cell wall-binding protein